MAPASVLDNMSHATQFTIDGFNAWDYAALRSTRSADFIYQFLPLSLGSPPRNNEEYGEFFKNVLTPAFHEFKVTPKSTVFDVDARKSVIYGKVDVQSLIGLASMELVLMMSFNEAGDKVTRIDEFFDSAVYNSFFAKLGEVMSQKGDQS